MIIRTVYQVLFSMSPLQVDPTKFLLFVSGKSLWVGQGRLNGL